MLEPRIMPASYASFFMFMLVHVLALVVSFLPIYASFRRYARDMAIFRYFLVLTCTAFDYLSMHVQQYACLVVVVDHTRCMYGI